MKTSNGRPLASADDFYRTLTDWEYAWCDTRTEYPAVPRGDTLAVAKSLYTKWLPVAHELMPPEQKVGDWYPPQMSTAEITLDWEVTTIVTAPGKYVFRIAYINGEHALAVSQAELLRNGVVVAQDTHDGWTGLEEYGQRYVLPVDASALVPSSDGKTAHYIFRLHLHSVGGTDSRGMIYVAKEVEKP